MMVVLRQLRRDPFPAMIVAAYTLAAISWTAIAFARHP
jgi:hypothetical protein